MSSIRPLFGPAPGQMRPSDRLLCCQQQELDPKVEEDEHFDVDDEGYEGVRQAPVHGISLTASCEFQIVEL